MNMNMAGTFDNQINKAAFWSAITLLVVTVPSLFLPLDAPDGPFADRVVWFSSNLGVFIVGWIVQLIAMLALSAVFAGALWQIANTHPLRAIVAGTALLISVVAFFIPKFIAIWSIPQMVVASATASAHSAVAEQLLQLLNVSLPFSLFTSFDYLGFWLYAVFSLLIAGPLFRLTLSAKIAAVGFGAYGLLFHVVLIGVLTRNIVQADIVSYVESVAGLLLGASISMAVYFRKAMASRAGE
jgi:hypothetical protein